MAAPERVSVIGAGLMGHALALVYALGGHPVGLYDTDPRRVNSATGRARDTAAPLLAACVVAPAALAAAIGRIAPTTDLAAAVANSGFIVEAVSEDLAIKQAVFRQLDQLAPPTAILATNSSALGPDDVAAATTRAEQVLVTHWFNPPTLLPLVEVVRGRHTSDAAVAKVVAQLTALGKRPVVVPRYTPGFAANRLQMAMVRECLALVDEGLLQPAEVDDVLRYSLAPRWAALGCFRIMDFGNTSLFAAAARTIFPHLSNAAAPGPALTERAAAGDEGVTTAQGFYAWPPGEADRQRGLRDAVVQAVLHLTNPPDRPAAGR
ncbi:MAG: 3-hydroxyacyl-CoA dehydrogenase family protein [Chloroflexi bacterium]|nr:3-hydroxyacyl-CoA dehydrogenase family protein [Chloroflexota bacterium]